MNYYSFPKKPAFRILFPLFLLGLMMLSRDSMYSISVFGFLPCQAATAAMTLILGLCLVIYHRKSAKRIFTDPRLILAGLAAVLFLLPMLVKRDWQLMYVSVVFYICIAVLISYFADVRTVSRYFLLVLSALAVYSVLCTYVLRIFADRGMLPVPEFKNTFDAVFYQFGFCVVSQTFVAMRNFGIFREPGVYQFFLILGVFLNNYWAQWEKPWMLWTVNGILAVTLLTTFATGGIIELALLLLFMGIEKKWYRNRTIRTVIYCGTAAIAAVVIWILATKNVFYDELTGVFGKFRYEISDPTESRLYPIQLNLKLFLQHPIFGARLRDVLYITDNNTTSTMIQYAAFGILTASFHVLAWGTLIWDRKRNVFANLFLLLICFMSFNTQNLIGNPMFWLFPVMALAERGIPAVSQWIAGRTGRAKEAGQ